MVECYVGHRHGQLRDSVGQLNCILMKGFRLEAIGSGPLQYARIRRSETASTQIEGMVRYNAELCGEGGGLVHETRDRKQGESSD